MNLSRLTTLVTRFFQSRKPVQPETSKYSPFSRAVYPVMKTMWAAKRTAVTSAQMYNFAEDLSHWSQGAFRGKVLSCLISMGYDAVPSKRNNFDILARRDGQNIVIRCLNNAKFFSYEDEYGPDADMMTALIDYKDSLSANAAMLFSVCPIQQEARELCRTNGVYGLCGYDLFKMFDLNQQLKLTPQNLAA